MADHIIAVDFDGTLCTNEWPYIGFPKYDVFKYIFDKKKDGAKIILWTNRTGDALTKAVEWCRGYGLIFDAVNENLPEIIEAFGGDTRKVFANEYIDDRMCTKFTFDGEKKEKNYNPQAEVYKILLNVRDNIEEAIGYLGEDLE